MHCVCITRTLYSDNNKILQYYKKNIIIKTFALTCNIIKILSIHLYTAKQINLEHEVSGLSKMIKWLYGKETRETDN